jgi:hypothetical protein
MMQLQTAPEGKEQKAAQAEVEKAEARLAKYNQRLSSALSSAESAPKVEVGCLEEVLSRMETDSDGEWSSVMFIPKGDDPLWFICLPAAHRHGYCFY